MSIVPAAIPVAEPAAPAAPPVTLREVHDHDLRFGAVALFAIGVSFVHMAAALALFAGAEWYEVGAALAMTLLVDVATWAEVEYIQFRRRIGRPVHPAVWGSFASALAISMLLNGAYLWAHRPPEDALPAWASAGIAVAFAAFVPVLIAVASHIRGELADLRSEADAEAEALRSARPSGGDRPAETVRSDSARAVRSARERRGAPDAHARPLPSGPAEAEIVRLDVRSEPSVRPAETVRSEADAPRPDASVRYPCPTCGAETGSASARANASRWGRCAACKGSA